MTSSTESATRWLFIHSSDEMFGADRVLLDILGCLPSEVRASALVWLPNDLEHGPFPLCERLAEAGIAYEHLPLPILRRANLTPAGIAKLTSTAKALRPSLARVSPGVVYGTTSATLPALRAVPRNSARILLHNQEVWKPREKHLLGRLARRAERIIAISQATRAAMPGFLDDRTVVVPNTTLDQQSLPTYRELTSLPTQPVRYLAAGRWTANKGFDVLLDAWAISAPGALAIAGSPPPTGEGLDLESQLRDNPNSETVTLLGQVDSISAAINESHVIVMPSSWPEPFGLVALEAMSAGRPVVATRVGGLAQFVNDDVGWLVDPRDPSALAATLASVTYEEIVRKGANARVHYEQHFSPQIFQQNWTAAVGL